MPYWTANKKPTWLNEAELERTELTRAGYVYTQPSGVEEILVAARSLMPNPTTGPDIEDWEDIDPDLNPNEIESLGRSYFGPMINQDTLSLYEDAYMRTSGENDMGYYNPVNGFYRMSTEPTTRIPSGGGRNSITPLGIPTTHQFSNFVLHAKIWIPSSFRDKDYSVDIMHVYIGENSEFITIHHNRENFYIRYWTGTQWNFMEAGFVYDPYNGIDEYDKWIEFRIPFILSPDGLLNSYEVWIGDNTVAVVNDIDFPANITGSSEINFDVGVVHKKGIDDEYVIDADDHTTVWYKDVFVSIA